MKLKHGIAMYGAETWANPKIDPTCFENYEMWCWRRMERVRWPDRVRNEKVLKSQGTQEHRTYCKM
jgi:hypothetical protein